MSLRFWLSDASATKSGCPNTARARVTSSAHQERELGGAQAQSTPTESAAARTEHRRRMRESGRRCGRSAERKRAALARKWASETRRFKWLGILVAQNACAEFDATATNEDAGFASAALPAIYGADDRIEVREHPDPAVREFARTSTAALVFAHRLRFERGDTVAFDTTTLGAAKDLCEGERFREQPALAGCTGTLIDGDLVLTAGHCLGSTPSEAQRLCRSMAIVFDFRYPDTGELTLHANDVAFCRDVVVRQFVEGSGTAPDYAIIQLDRGMGLERKPASVAWRAVVPEESTILIGNGAGLPTKVDTGGVVLEEQTHPEFFRVNSDGFVGGSGSPLLDKALQVLGVQSRGGRDFTYDDGCYRLTVAQSGSELHQKASNAIQALCAAGWPSAQLCQRTPTCGDGVCSSTETRESCPADCPTEACGDGVCSPSEWTLCDGDCEWLRRVPTGWWCPPHLFADGESCDCSCGAADPDCADASLPVRGCGWGQRCDGAGRCASADTAAVDLLHIPRETEQEGPPPGCSLSQPGTAHWTRILSAAAAIALVRRLLRRAR